MARDKTTKPTEQKPPTPACSRSDCVDGWISTFSNSGPGAKIRCSCGRAG